jgi:hypothetical protein
VTGRPNSATGTALPGSIAFSPSRTFIAPKEHMSEHVHGLDALAVVYESSVVPAVDRGGGTMIQQGQVFKLRPKGAGSRTRVVREEVPTNDVGHEAATQLAAEAFGYVRPSIMFMV